MFAHCDISSNVLVAVASPLDEEDKLHAVFDAACRLVGGALCGAPMYGVRFEVEDQRVGPMRLNSLKGQMLYAMSRAMHGVMVLYGQQCTHDTFVRPEAKELSPAMRGSCGP